MTEQQGSRSFVISPTPHEPASFFSLQHKIPGIPEDSDTETDHYLHLYINVKEYVKYKLGCLAGKMGFMWCPEESNGLYDGRARGGGRTKNYFSSSLNGFESSNNFFLEYLIL